MNKLLIKNIIIYNSKNSSIMQLSKINSNIEYLIFYSVNLVKNLGNQRSKLKLLHSKNKKNLEEKLIPYSSINKNIPILYSCDESHALILKVSMTSICLNKKNTTHVKFYILVPGDFPIHLERKIKTVEQFFSYCTIERFIKYD